MYVCIYVCMNVCMCVCMCVCVRSAVVEDDPDIACRLIEVRREVCIRFVDVGVSAVSNVIESIFARRFCLNLENLRSHLDQ